MPRFGKQLCVISALTFGVACAQSEGTDPVEAGAFEEGMTQTTSNGAFTVELRHGYGGPTVGMNDFVIRIAVPHPSDPENDGWGVPNAAIDVVASMPNDGISMDATPKITYRADGFYEIEGVEFTAAGVWQLEFDIAVGETIEEYVAFTFVVDEA